MQSPKQLNAFRKELFRKLNPFARATLEGAIGLAELRGNPKVELVHWLNQIFTSDSPLDALLLAKHFKVDLRTLDQDIAGALRRLPTGGTGDASISPFLVELITQSWPFTTLLFGSNSIRTGHLLFTLRRRSDLWETVERISEEFSKISVEPLLAEFGSIAESSAETATDIPAEEVGGTAGAAVGTPTETSALGRFTSDLTEKARTGKVDPIVGRDSEIRQLIDVLTRRSQNNPVLIGDAGVGKTAVAEGFAHRIVAGDVPAQFKDVAIRALDVGLLQAGASMKGEFEQRLRSVIDEVEKSPKPIILFIDEVHTLIGAGGQAGTGDAANLLKPALARGQLRTVAATTWDEYRKHIEKDPALSRRFQPVYVAEPDEDKAISMLRVTAYHLEKHHRVDVLDEAIDAAVRLSVRFLPARQLPDKAVSLLDTASARVTLGRGATPAVVEDCEKRIRALETERDILRRERATGSNHAHRIEAVESELRELGSRLETLRRQWMAERELVESIVELRRKLMASGDKAASDPDRNGAVQQLEQKQKELTDLQGENPMVFTCVDRACVSSVIAEWTGIPVGRMARRTVAEVLDLPNILERRVIGQRHALETIARRVQGSRARLENPERPVAVFMFVGPSGTGKTETALALAEALYGGEQNLITINMAEFQERHTVSTLKGSPPGYVGYGDGGVLTEAVRRRPYSVVLLDEVEKAHPDVHKMFFQVFDKGYMEDSEGRPINFRNTIIILTSNAAQDVVMDMCRRPQERPYPEALERGLRGPLAEVFPDALLNRLVVVPYYPISQDILQRIVRLNLGRVEQRLRENHEVPFTYDDSVVEAIAGQCGELERGARMVEALITNSIIPRISQEILSRSLDGSRIGRVHLSTHEKKIEYSFDQNETGA